MNDSVQIRCSRCKSVFRERARRLQNGYSRQCPTCEVVMFFDEDSPKPDIRRAMKTARQVRKQLHEAEVAAALGAASGAAPPEAVSQRYAGRQQIAPRRRAQSRES